MSDLDDDLSVDLTPLIDVTFMLVIFFIMTMTFAVPSLTVELPSSETSQPKQGNSALLTVSVDEHGVIYLDKNAVAPDELRQILKAGSYEGIILNIDKNAPAQAVIDMADLARIHAKGALAINTVLDEARP